MRAWCRKKLTSARNSNNYSNKEEEEDEQHGSTIKASSKGKAKSFEQHLIRKSRKNSSGSHSDGVTHSRPHPLPPPSFSSLLAHASAAPSASVSSVSSSGSSDDSPNLGFTTPCSRYQDPANSTSNGSVKPDLQKQQLTVDSRHQVSASPFSDQSKLPELLISPGTEFQSNGYNRTASPEIEFNTRSRSPGPTSRPHSLLSSPVHIRLSGFNPESSAERQGNGKLLGHPLPLPPGSPSASSSHTFKTNGIRENGYSLHSKWKKGKLLGRGTFGHVYVGFNSVSGQFCAIKEVRVIIDDQNSKESLKQLNQEITLLSQLSHPNIVQYYGSELAEETLSVYLEYVSGGSIHKLLQEYGPFEEPVIQSYTGQILSGLAYLHERDTVHRDIKGANILVDPNGGIKLADFGMAKHITSCTNMLSFKGSPYWMAPEVIMNTNGYNLAVDIWSLGCTIIEMATSKPPWSQHEGVAAIFKIGNSKDMPDIPDHISEAGKNFLKLCLQRDPSARPTAVELLEHPFVRDRTVAEVAKIKLSKTLHPFSANGSQSPNSVEWQSHRLLNARSYDGDYRTKQKVGVPPAFVDSSHRVRTKMPMSLPVSPRSNPRVSGPADRSGVLSPPHPTYSLGMTGYKSHPVSPRRVYQNGNNPDPWADVPQRRSQTPDGSPRARHMRNAYL